jgi:hypothetical protein
MYRIIAIVVTVVHALVAGDCPSGWEELPGGTDCVYLIRNQSTFLHAERACQVKEQLLDKNVCRNCNRVEQLIWHRFVTRSKIS